MEYDATRRRPWSVGHIDESGEYMELCACGSQLLALIVVIRVRRKDIPNEYIIKNLDTGDLLMDREGD